MFEWDPVTDEASWANEQIYRIFGRTLAEGSISRAQFTSDYLHPSDRAKVDAAIETAIRGRSYFHLICRARGRRKDWRWLQIDAKHEKATSGRPARFVGIVADITRREMTERRAQRLARRLLTIQEEERRSIAMELHDSTVQHLVAASLVLSTVSDQQGRDVETAVGTVEDSLQEAMRELRTFSYLMHPPALQQHSLYEALAAYVSGFAARSGLRCNFRMERNRTKFTADVQRSVLRIVQEGLANAYRHASAKQVSIHVKCLGARLHIVVADNGRGIAPELTHSQRPSRSGVGIRGIRMRLRQLGGRMRISTPAKGGTRLHAVLPIGRS